ncbi:unnamed protein product [Lathyrus sativus]|nr:unnamed protein product [Lathyrus sativus]
MTHFTIFLHPNNFYPVKHIENPKQQQHYSKVLKCGWRTEHSEIDFTADAASNVEGPQNGFEDLSPPSDFNHTVNEDDGSLAIELHEKLDLKDETKKVRLSRKFYEDEDVMLCFILFLI